MMEGKAGKKGGVSIFLCLVLAGALLVASACLQGVRMRQDDLAIRQALAVAADSAGSAYSAVLRDRFGHFCLPLPVNRERTRSVFLSALPDRLGGLPLSVRPVGNAFLPENIAGQALSYMQWRVPLAAILLQESRRTGPLLEGARTLRDIEAGTAPMLPDLTGDQVRQMVFALMNPGFPEVDIPWMREYGTPKAVPTRDPREEADPGEPRPDWDPAASDAASLLLAAATSLPGEERNGEEGARSLLDMIPSDSPVGILDGLLRGFLPESGADASGMLRWLQLRMFAASTMRSACDRVRDEAGLRPLRDLSGIPLEDRPSAWQYELEHLVAGRDSPEADRKAVEGELLSFRFSMHWTALLLVPEEYGVMRAASAALVLLVGSLSPTLVLSVDGVALLLCAARAYLLARDEVDRLLSGDRIPLLPESIAGYLSRHAWSGLPDPDIGYREWLSLRMAVLPEPLLLERIAFLYGTLVPEGAARGVSVVSRIRSIPVAYERRFP